MDQLFVVFIHESQDSRYVRNKGYFESPLSIKVVTNGINVGKDPETSKIR